MFVVLNRMENVVAGAMSNVKSTASMYAFVNRFDCCMFVDVE